MRNFSSAGVAAALLVAAIPAAGQLPAMNQQGDLRWICGGVGADERRALDALRARIGSVERSRTVRVPDKGIARAVLSFPEEPWDGIRASEEEKRQARAP